MARAITLKQRWEFLMAQAIGVEESCPVQPEPSLTLQTGSLIDTFRLAEGRNPARSKRGLIGLEALTGSAKTRAGTGVDANRGTVAT